MIAINDFIGGDTTRGNINDWNVTSIGNERDTTKDVYAIRTKLPKFQFPTGGKRTRHRNHRTRKGKRNRTKRYIKIYI
jgi:hypothetical protein